MTKPTLNARLRPFDNMDVLSRGEIARLRDASHGGAYEMLKRCALAVMTSGNYADDPRAPHADYPNFNIEVQQDDRGLWLELHNAPAGAFVDGRIIRGVNELLFAVVRDIVYVGNQLETDHFELQDSAGITNAVFEILRNARLLNPRIDPNLVVCWGGHSISRTEYDYTKRVGYELGLRALDICTGCGPGAMKGPMKGATIGHTKQRRSSNRYIGITEPGIISAEPPNPIVNHLIIMPDIEKRLEAFVRLGHGVIVFPGGVGTAEEIFYLLGILLHPANRTVPFPLVFTGPASAADYFAQIDRFLQLTLGEAATERYKIIIDDPREVGQTLQEGMNRVKNFRRAIQDAFFFNWTLTIDQTFQQPFQPTHDNIASLDLRRERPPHELAADLRRAFSAIVAGNVKEHGIQQIEQHGPYQIHGEQIIMDAMDELLNAFIEQQRMKLPGMQYTPCYEVLSTE